MSTKEWSNLKKLALDQGYYSRQSKNSKSEVFFSNMFQLNTIIIKCDGD